MKDIELRTAILRRAIEHTKHQKGKARDLALFDYLCGACGALWEGGHIETDCPPWLWIIGIRGGDRLAEIRRMIPADETP